MSNQTNSSKLESRKQCVKCRTKKPCDGSNNNFWHSIVKEEEIVVPLTLPNISDLSVYAATFVPGQQYVSQPPASCDPVDSESQAGDDQYDEAEQDYGECDIAIVIDNVSILTFLIALLLASIKRLGAKSSLENFFEIGERLFCPEDTDSKHEKMLEERYEDIHGKAERLVEELVDLDAFSKDFSADTNCPGIMLYEQSLGYPILLLSAGDSLPPNLMALEKCILDRSLQEKIPTGMVCLGNRDSFFGTPLHRLFEAFSIEERSSVFFSLDSQCNLYMQWIAHDFDGDNIDYLSLEELLAEIGDKK